MENKPNQATPPPPAIEFGPSPQDTAGYRELLRRVEMDLENVELPNPRVNAELTSARIDSGELGTFTAGEAEGEDLVDRTRLKMAQQRYVAAAIGLEVGPLQINYKTHTAKCAIALPKPGELPPLPTKDSAGSFIDERRRPMSTVQADARYSAHFIAAHTKRFSQPGAFEGLFKRVVLEAEQGQLEIKGTVKDHRGARSLLRQTARVLGYQVGEFSKDKKTGNYVMPVGPVRKGFESGAFDKEA